LRTCGVLVQVGILGREVTAPLGAIVVKEIDYRGTFRFDKEFGQAVDLIASGALNLRAVLSHRIPFANIIEALDLASDRSAAMKVQVVFD
jgi:L-idonate 5-dehydrogenase